MLDCEIIYIYIYIYILLIIEHKGDVSPENIYLLLKHVHMFRSSRPSSGHYYVQKL